MGLDFYNKNDVLYINWSGWRHLYELAEKNGWEPMGTVLYTRTHNDDDQVPLLRPPRHEDVSAGIVCIDETWEGGYFSNSFQTITEKDAHNLANALDKAFNYFLEEIYIKNGCKSFVPNSDFKLPDIPLVDDSLPHVKWVDCLWLIDAIKFFRFGPINIS